MRTVTAVRGVVIVLTLLVLAPGATASEQETYYLGSEGFPNGELVLNPRGGQMPNYDMGRDIEPGLLVERSSLGLAEREETRYQHWQIELGGQRLTGYPSVVIWSAPAGFDAEKRGMFTVFLLDCPALADPCTRLASGEVIVAEGEGRDWVESTIDFSAIDHPFSEDRYLGVRVVVPDSSEADMMFAYGYPHQRSRLTIYPERPVTVTENEPASARLAFSDGPPIENAHRLSLLPPPTPAAEPDESEPASPRLLSLLVSTAVLAILGAVLVSSLTKTGKHERRSYYGNDRSQRRRISVPAP